MALVAAAVSCGKKGMPRPPEPRGPLPPRAVEARQLGDRVLVSFEVPRSRGEAPAQQPIRVELVRVEYRPGIDAPADPDAFRRRGAVVTSLERDPLVAGSRLTVEDRDWKGLEDGGVGWTLRYGVRVRDRRSRPSPLVVALDLVPGETLSPPSSLRAEPTADGIRLAWTAPAGEGPYRYSVYRAEGGESFGERPLNPQPLTTEEYLDTSVVTGEAYRYAVRTTGATDAPPFRESASGPEMELVAADRFAPAAPGGLVGVQEGDAVRLFWDPSQERDLSGYRVYRRREPGEWERVGADPVPEPQFLDEDVEAGTILDYRVTAVDRAVPPNESEPSETVAVVLGDEADEAD